MVYSNYTEATPLAMLTLGQFKEVMANAMPQQIKEMLREQPKPEATPTYVYGLAGIRQMFGVSHAHAQKLKDTILAPAVKQYGRKIVVDARMAMELFANRNRR